MWFYLITSLPNAFFPFLSPRPSRAGTRKAEAPGTGWGEGLLDPRSPLCPTICNIDLLCCKRGLRISSAFECVYIISDSCKVGLLSPRTLVPFPAQLDMPHC